jgi:hypothetical protein
MNFFVQRSALLSVHPAARSTSSSFHSESNLAAAETHFKCTRLSAILILQTLPDLGMRHIMGKQHMERELSAKILQLNTSRD